MKTCRDCYHCKTKIPVKDGRFLFYHMKGVRCDMDVWPPKKTEFTAFMRETFSFVSEAERYPFYQSMK